MSSLNRKEWEEMWKLLKQIENEVHNMAPQAIPTSQKYIFSKTKRIKEPIQSVIEQIE